MSFSWQSLKHEFRDGTLYATIGSLVMMYREDGTLAARYSDFACCDYGNQDAPKKDSQTATPLSNESSGLIPNRYQTQFQLPVGEYNIRVVLSDGQNFSVQQLPLTARQYDASQLGLSDVALSRRVRKLSTNATDAAQQVYESYTPLISKGVEFTPAGSAQFWPSDTLFAYFEINDPLVAGQPETMVQANMRTVDIKSGAVVETFAPVDTATYTQAGRPVIAVGRGVLVNRLPPGEYRLEVQATNADGQSSEWRSAVFSVVEVPPLELNGAASPKDKRDEVIVNVAALDSDNRPVTDLSGGDFQIFEDDRRQEITSFRPTAGRTAGAPPPIVILFDLLNTIPRQREYIASRIIKVLEPLQRDEGIYLYLLTNEGALYPVRPKGNMQAPAIAQGSIGEGPGANVAEGSPWTKEIRPLLNQAIDEVHGFRLMDFKDVGMRAATTFNRLGQIEGEMANVRGPQTILWITSGVPNSIPHPYGGCQDQTFYGVSESYLAGRCGWECHPSLPDTKCLDHKAFFQHFGAEAVALNTTVSSVAVTDSGLQNFDRGTPANTLRQLAELTGGRVNVSGNSEVETAIHEALQSVLGRYTIAYTAPVSDGKRHKLRVESTREGIHLMAPRERFAALAGDHPSDSQP
jgi:hypothetical protein